MDLGYPSTWENPHAWSVPNDERVMAMETFVCCLALLQFHQEYQWSKKKRR